MEHDVETTVGAAITDEENRLRRLEQQLNDQQTTLDRQQAEIDHLRRQQRRSIADFMELLGSTLVNQSRRLSDTLVHPTTLKAVPSEEAENEGTLHVSLRDDLVVIFKPDKEGNLVRIQPKGVDYDVIKSFLEAQPNPTGLHPVNLYLDQ